MLVEPELIKVVYLKSRHFVPFTKKGLLKLLELAGGFIAEDELLDGLVDELVDGFAEEELEGLTVDDELLAGLAAEEELLVVFAAKLIVAS